MKWLSNFSLIMRSNLTTLCEKCEDPERMLHQLLIDMESELGRVRESVAGAIADEIQLGRKVQQADDEAGGMQSYSDVASGESGRSRCVPNASRSATSRLASRPARLPLPFSIANEFPTPIAPSRQRA